MVSLIWRFWPSIHVAGQSWSIHQLRLSCYCQHIKQSVIEVRLPGLFMEIWQHTNKTPGASRRRSMDGLHTSHWINVILTLVHRLRRWTNVKPHWFYVLCLLGYVHMLGQHLWGLVNLQPLFDNGWLTSVPSHVSLVSPGLQSNSIFLL